MKEKILITGATGFVGACLTENLVKEGNEVHIIARQTSNMWRLKKVKNELAIHEVDLRDGDKVETLINEVKPENIYHLATYGAYYYQDNIKKTIDSNITGTINLINAAVKQDFNAFINIGSSSEYGTKSDRMKEDMVLEPINTYGVTKAAATLYARMMGSNLKRPISTLRLFSAYGYYEDKTRLVPSAILSCINGENPKLASGDAVRDFIFIEDIIELIKQVSKANNTCGMIYNAGTGKQHSVAEMVNCIVNQISKEILPQWGSIPGRKSDTNKWEANMGLVEKELGWKPKYSLEAGVKKSIDWFKDNINLYKE